MRIDQRTSPRVPLDVYLNKIVGEDVFMCRAADISPDGLYLSHLIEPALEGSTVGVELALPGTSDVIWARGEVVREGRRGGAPGSGIRFTILPEAYRRLIEAYVRERLPASDEVALPAAA